MAGEGGRWGETGVGDGGEGGTGGVPVPVSVPVVSEIQVEYSTCSSILRVFCQYEVDYKKLPEETRRDKKRQEETKIGGKEK